MGFIKHFSDDMPCTIPDNPNLYFPKDPTDWLKSKEIRFIKGWYVCYEKNKKTAKFKSLEIAVRWLNER